MKGEKGCEKTVRNYLLITFVIMAICWGGCVLCGAFGIYLTEMPLLYVPYIIGGLSPTIASYAALRRSGGVSGFREWLGSVFDFRHNLLSYLMVLLFAGVFFLCLCGVCGYESGARIFAVIFMIPMMLFGGGLEETGWRGILQPELEKKLGYTAATLIVAVIWWIWHLPLFFINGVSQYGADFISFGLNVLGLSFALSAIKRNTGSTWLCVLFHCIINSLHSVFIINNGRLGNCAAAAVVILLSYILVYIQKKKQIFI